MNTHATDPADSRNKPRITEFKLARQLTRHSAAEVAKALDVSRSTVSRWESGELDAPQDVVEWLQINRNYYLTDVRPLCRFKDENGKPGKRGEDLRPNREAAVYEVTAAVAAAAAKSA